MPDEIDRAQGINEQLQADALDVWRSRQPTGPGRSHCIDCEEEIPERRRQALPGVERCVDCQQALEVTNRRI